MAAQTGTSRNPYSWKSDHHVRYTHAQYSQEPCVVWVYPLLTHEIASEHNSGILTYHKRTTWRSTHHLRKKKHKGVHHWAISISLTSVLKVMLGIWTASRTSTYKWRRRRLSTNIETNDAGPATAGLSNKDAAATGNHETKSHAARRLSSEPADKHSALLSTN